MNKKLGRKRNLNQTNLDKVPNKPGIYLIRNKKDNEQYIGMTTRLRSRLQHHLSQQDIPGARSFQIRSTRSVSQAEKLEEKYMRNYRPKYNIQKKK
jgi:excinuclease ABC subunit C